MSKVSCLDRIRDRIITAVPGTAFVASDFVDVSDKVKINIYLTRLEKEGVLRRVIRGVYDKPEYNSFLGEYIAPIPDNVANAIARNFGWTIAPCGDTALNLLGLSTQMPVKWVYVTDGANKSYRFGDSILQFKSTTNKEISKLSRKTVLVVQALKALGKENVTEKVIEKLKANLTEEEKHALFSETKTVTSWIYEDIKLICSEEI